MRRLVSYKGGYVALDEAVAALLSSVRRSWSRLMPSVDAGLVSWWLSAGGAGCNPVVALEGRVVCGVINACLEERLAEVLLHVRGGDERLARLLLSSVY